MKHLKIYENFDNPNNYNDIDDICKKLRSESRISNYSINNDGSVDAATINIENMDLIEIPIKFNKITDDGFYCGRNKLINLNNSPHYINGHFYCNVNNLTTLENSPEYVGGFFTCAHNKLKTLLNGPKIVGGLKNARNRIYDFSSNNLFNVYGFPENFSGQIISHNNPVHEILELVSYEYETRFIYWLNEYTVIRKGNTDYPIYNIVRDRLEEALSAVGINELTVNGFPHYRLI